MDDLTIVPVSTKITRSMLTSIMREVWPVLNIRYERYHITSKIDFFWETNPEMFAKLDYGMESFGIYGLIVPEGGRPKDYHLETRLREMHPENDILIITDHAVTYPDGYKLHGHFTHSTRSAAVSYSSYGSYDSTIETWLTHLVTHELGHGFGIRKHCTNRVDGRFCTMATSNEISSAGKKLFNQNAGYHFCEPCLEIIMGK
jgi:hypothetical protein